MSLPPHLPFSPPSKKLSIFVNLLSNWCHTLNCAFILGNSYNFCASLNVPYVYNIRLHCDRTSSVGHFRTVTSLHIHATHFILMNKKDFFFLFECWPNKKKIITVEHLFSSLKGLILSFAGRKRCLTITHLHKQTANKFDLFFSFNVERILV